jgi:antitoxin HicB
MTMAHEPREFDVVLERAEEGGFVVSVPDLPGVWTQGETREEALMNVRSAIAGYLETLEAEGWPVPEPVIERATVTA